MRIKEQKVELIELFYDLIYVYAISKLTGLLEIPDNGTAQFFALIRYLIMFLAILQSWLYMTNYINRYVRWSWFEYLFTLLNMISIVYLSNSITNDWGEYYIAFNCAMVFSLMTVAMLYIIQMIKDNQKRAAVYFLKSLLPSCVIYLIAMLFSAIGAPEAAMACNALAVLAGAFLPFFIKNDFDISIISFSHLVERFELLTIITFGEAVTGMTGYFDVKNLSPLPILIFLVIIALFGSYVVQIHHLMKHERVTRALRLMFSHYVIVIAINLIAVGIHLLQEQNEISVFVPGILLAAELLFYAAILADSTYYYEQITRTTTDKFILLLSQIPGMLFVVFFRNNIFGIVIGMLEIALAGFMCLFRKYRIFKEVIESE